MLTWETEDEYYSRRYKIICGADEAGRGPLAGPVCAAACILSRDIDISGLDDSKKLSEKKRDLLFDEIKEKAISYGIAFASPEEIDSINILNASMLAMKRAISMLSPIPDAALIDGNIARGFDQDAFPIIKGDAKSPSIAAASILAKVSRDRLCAEMDREYPEYGFAKHKGYPTKEHMEAVRKYGPSPIH